MTHKAQLFRLSVHVGTQVNEMAAHFRSAGAIDVLAGTETVYWTYSGDNGDEARVRTVAGLKRVHGTSFGLQPFDMHVMRQESM